MMSSQSRLMAFGVALHALLIYAMFDVHFITPLVHDVEPTAARFRAPASRLVIIVADGLRGDRLFELEEPNPEDSRTLRGVPRAPFLHAVAETGGRWGISHARPPTESRPGHVALLAGFYEDPSAITKGWQANAVEFDHLLNQSSAAWAIGAPSVVPLFAKNIPHARQRMYAEELEDFAASNDHAALDEWVFDRAIEVLRGNVTEEEAANGATVELERAALEGDRVVFLLHLLGLDSAGHAHKPFGEAYAKNVRVVDDGVRRLSAAFKERFGSDEKDGGTAFVFTADHGMSSRGAHGDGDPGCTETPLVVWGAGVAAASVEGANVDPACRSRGKDAPTPESEWGLLDAARCDVDQADIASLGSSLLGVAPPTQNTGVLPVSYLDPNDRELRSGAALANTAQLLAVYRRKTTVVAASSLVAFLTGGLKPYAPLANADLQLASVEAARDAGEHARAITLAQALSRECVDGVNYLHLYDRGLLTGVVAACFLGWVGYLGAELASQGGEVGAKSTVADAMAAMVVCVVCAVLVARRSPVTYFAYFNLPVFFARRCFAAIGTTRAALATTPAKTRLPKSGKATPKGSSTTWTRRVVAASAGVGVTQLLCQSFHEREVYSGLFASASAALAVLAAGIRGAGAGARNGSRGSARASAASATSRAAIGAAIGAAVLAPFTLLPVELEANSGLVIGGVGCTAAVAIAVHLFLRPLDIFGDDHLDPNPDSAGGKSRPGSKLLILQLSLLWAAGLVVWIVDGLQSAKASIPAGLHAAAWLVAAAAAPLPFISPPRTLPRFTSVYLAAATVYALFSVSYESLFYAALGAASLAWLVLERCAQRLGVLGELSDAPAPIVQFKTDVELRGVREGDARHAAVFLVLINAAFFSTGNIASVASFEISSVYRFTTRFNPFLMGGLLMLKVLIPMITVAVAFLALLKLQRVSSFQVYLIFIALSDLMAARFFFQVTTEGSWQDIGMSISRYALMGTQVVTILVFLGLADMYTHKLPVNGIVAVRRGDAKKTL